jgi:hypothetical protein
LNDIAYSGAACSRISYLVKSPRLDPQSEAASVEEASTEPASVEPASVEEDPSLEEASLEDASLEEASPPPSPEAASVVAASLAASGPASGLLTTQLPGTSATSVWFGPHVIFPPTHWSAVHVPSALRHVVPLVGEQPPSALPSAPPSPGVFESLQAIAASPTHTAVPTTKPSRFVFMATW